MILTVDKSKKIARNLSDTFFNMGYLARGATPAEALTEISEKYRAIIITSPEMLTDAEEFIKKLRLYSTNIPIFTFEGRFASESPHLFDAVLAKNSYSPKIISEIVEFANKNSLPAPGRYSIMGIDASAGLANPTFGLEGLPFTKTECMIIRYLIKVYPAPASAEEILEYAYKPSKLPDSSNIRTHISIINRKFMKIAERKLISPAHGSGYAIFASELLEVK